MTKVTNNVQPHCNFIIIIFLIACIVVDAVNSLRTIRSVESSTIRWHLQGKVIRYSTVTDGGEDTAATVAGGRVSAESSEDLKNYLEKSIPW